MFNKRLLKEFTETKKYIIIMIFVKWISLLCNMTVFWCLVMFLINNNVDLIFIILGCILIRLFFTKIFYKYSKISADIVKYGLRCKIYNKLLKINYNTLMPTGEIVQISTEGVEQLEIYFSNYIPQFFYSLLAPFTLFLAISTMSFKIAIILLIMVPLIPMSIVFVQKLAKKLLNKYWGIYVGLSDSFLENLQGLTTLKVYNVDEKYAEKMDEEAENFRKITMRVLIMQLNSISIMDLFTYLGAGIGIILSVFEYRSGNLSFSEAFFIIMVSSEFYLPLRLLGSFFHIAMNGNAAADKIFKLLDFKEEEKEDVNIEKSNIEIKNLNFKYNEKDVLKNINLTINQGEIVGLVGKSGSGKSTLVSLLMKEYTNYSGNIFIGDYEIKNISNNSIYNKIIKIGNDSHIFKDTIYNNLCMGKKFLEEELIEVLKIVDLYEFVLENGGIYSLISKETLSGGQRQRFALARALLYDVDIYIFDEATSNVDSDSEDKIISIIEKLAKIKTIIMISHRLKNVENVDKIYVLNDGMISEVGSHKELMDKKSIYYNLYLSQKELERYRE